MHLLARRTRRTALVGGVAAVCVTLAGCGLGTAGGFVPSGVLAGPVAEADGALEGADLTVGSKNFNENVILGKMVIILARAAGADVTDLTNIPGSAPARQAHEQGDLDAMWEYTGTGWLVYLGEESPVDGAEEQYVATRDADLERNDLVWLPPAPMNNTYAFAVTQETAEEYPELETLSDIADLPVEDRTFCLESEFANRADGFPGLLEAYELELGSPQGVPEANLQIYQTGAIYEATADGACTLGEVFTTDGRILALDLKVLEDDRRYLPSYNVSLVVREDFISDYPELADIVAPVSAELTDEVLLDLNARVDVDGEEPAQVAYDWLEETGFIASQ